MRLPLSKMLNLTLSACVAMTAMSSAASAKATAKPAAFRLTDASLTDSEPMGVTLDDLVRYAPSRVSDAGILQKLIQSSDPRIFQMGEAICGIPSVGVTHKSQSGKISTAKVKAENTTICGNTYLETAPQSEDGKTATYPLAILMESAQGPVFRKVAVEVSPVGKGREVTNVQVLGDTPIARTHFSISVGLVPNVQVLQDATNDLLIVSPIGNGGLTLDNGSTRKMMTPLFNNAQLMKNFTIPDLNLDTYYRDEPYIAIVTNNGGRVQPIAFHVTILNDSTWNDGKGSEFLLRGYQSHGCMRMRLHDLLVLYTIVTQSSGPLPVTVDYFASLMDQSGKLLVGDESDPINGVHPYPVMRGSYQQEKNMAAPGMPPMTGRDTDPKINHHEIVTESAPGLPPYAKLVGFDGEDEAALASYQTLMKKQTTGIKHKPVVKAVVKKVAPVTTADVLAATDVAPAVQPAVAQ